MLTLALVGIVSGLITAISPCVLPVLPAILASAVPPPPKIPVAIGVGGVLAGSPMATSKAAKGKGSDAAAHVPAASEPAGTAKGSRSRPILVVAGLVTSFAIFTLLGGAILGALHLPQDALRWAGIVVLVVVGVGLLVPAVGHIIEKPFQSSKMPQLNRGGSGFVMGLALGLIFVPCAGPILAAITVLAATNGLSWGLVVLTLAFSVGIAIPLLGFALAGQSIVTRVKAVRERLDLFRKISGAILILTGVLIAMNVFEPLQRLVPPVLGDAQSAIEDNSAVRDQLDALAGREPAGPATGEAMSFDECANDPTTLHNCGPARDFTNIEAWLNTADYTSAEGDPLTIDDLKGKVVLVDFWTYSCINCQRTLPFITAWYDKYKDDGFVVVGVHTPEFAFEKVESNVASATQRFGVHYPVALDNKYSTWFDWQQRFWPAHYLIDKDGVVRQVHYGEGSYAETEALIQQLLDAPVTPPVTADAGAHTSGRSPETYVGLRPARGPREHGLRPRQALRLHADRGPGAGHVLLRGELDARSGIRRHRRRRHASVPLLRRRRVPRPRRRGHRHRHAGGRSRVEERHRHHRRADALHALFGRPGGGPAHARVLLRHRGLRLHLRIGPRQRGPSLDTPKKPREESTMTRTAIGIATALVGAALLTGCGKTAEPSASDAMMSPTASADAMMHDDTMSDDTMSDDTMSPSPTDAMMHDDAASDEPVDTISGDEMFMEPSASASSDSMMEDN